MYGACMSPTLNRNTAIRRFEHGNAIEEITFDFYTGLSHIVLRVWWTWRDKNVLSISSGQNVSVKIYPPPKCDFRTPELPTPKTPDTPPLDLVGVPPSLCNSSIHCSVLHTYLCVHVQWNFAYSNLKYPAVRIIRPRSLHILFNARAGHGAK